MKNRQTAGHTVSRAPLAAPPAWILVLVAIALGLIARVVSLSYAPRYSYEPDHVMVMSWSAAAWERGPLSLYFMPRPEDQPTLLIVRRYDALGTSADEPVIMPMPYNYPPASTAIFWFQGWLWSVLDADVRQIPVPITYQRRFELPETLERRVINTPVSRTVAATPGILFDFWLAWGVAALVRALRGTARAPRIEALAFGLTLLAPPVFLDSAFWNQADSWIAAPLVWCLVWLIQRRWLAAGVVYGAALMIKPQAILLGPVLVFVLIGLLWRGQGAARSPGRNLFGFALFALTAVVVAGAIAMPFMSAAPPDDWKAHLGDDAAWRRWFDRSYGDLVFGDKYARTTLNAFNVWWFEYASRVGAAIEAGQRPDYRAIQDASAIAFAGLSKTAVGKLLLLTGIALTWVGCLWRWGGGTLGWTGCAYLVLLAAFLLPTSVHERYIYYCIPFAIALAMLRPLFFIPLGLLLIVGTAELLTANGWVKLSDPGVRTNTVNLAALSVLAFIISLALLWKRERSAAPPS